MCSPVICVWVTIQDLNNIKYQIHVFVNQKLAPAVLPTHTDHLEACTVMNHTERKSNEFVVCTAAVAYGGIHLLNALGIGQLCQCQSSLFIVISPSLPPIIRAGYLMGRLDENSMHEK